MKNNTRNFKSLYVLLVVLAIVVCGVVALGVASLSAADSSGDDATSALYTNKLLAQAGITLSEDDKVIRRDNDGAISIDVIRAFDVKVIYRGEEFTVKSTGATVVEAIEAAGITLSGAESVTPDINSQVTEDTVITIVGDNVVTVVADGETKEVATKAGSVSELFEEIGLTLGEDDVLSVNEDDKITDGMTITVKRVEYKEETKTEVIDYEFITEETDSLYVGENEIDTYGIEGEKEVTYKCKYVDGELVDTEVIKEEVIKEPVDQVELVGTYEEPEYVEPEFEEPQYEEPDYSSNSSSGAGTFTDYNGNTVSYTNVLTGSATAYSADEGSYTATGVPVYQGGVAVNPNIIPYGSKLYIVADDGSVVYGYATAVDTGGALMSGEALVDVFYPTYSECINWGRRNVTVYVLG